MTFQETNKEVDFYNLCIQRYWYWWHLLCHSGTWFIRKISLFSLLMPEYAICYVRKLRVLILHSICECVSHIIYYRHRHQIPDIIHAICTDFSGTLTWNICVLKEKQNLKQEKKWCSVINRCALLKSWAPATIRILKINTYTIYNNTQDFLLIILLAHVHTFNCKKKENWKKIDIRWKKTESEGINQSK